MPFALSTKQSKTKLRQNAPSPLAFAHPSQPLPTPPPSNDGSFKMFWKKKPAATTAPTSPLPYYPAEAPRPILKTYPSGSSPTSIRFATNGAGQHPGSSSAQTPSIIVTSQPDSAASSPSRPSIALPRPASTAQAHMQHGQHGTHSQQVQQMGSMRRSSRPTSPSASSFGARIRTSQCSISSTSTMMPAMPLSTAPSGTHITTPPTAYVSTFQERAPPPPSPYRPTSERARTSTSFARPLPELQLLDESNLISRPPRHSSLFGSSDSMATLPGTMVPMLNIIPATPQQPSDEFTVDRMPSPRQTLEEAVRIEEMDDIPLDPPVMPAAAVSFGSGSTGLPSIDINLDFSPFSPLSDLPDTDDEMDMASQRDYEYSYGYNGTTQSLPPSPPFESFPSLPSLSSHASMPSSASEASIPNSSSTDSLASFPDVEEALGSMLASLSDNDLPELHMPKSKRDTIVASGMSANPGLGLGLDLPEAVQMSTSMTAPLSPARRRNPPPPLDLRRAKSSQKPALASAPPCINHRVAFYRTAKAAPNSPTSGIFTVDLGLSDHSPLSALDLNWMGSESYHASGRDSLSLKSEASDDDLHTASIISLTPVLGDRARMVEVSDQVMLPGSVSVEAEVGLAL